MYSIRLEKPNADIQKPDTHTITEIRGRLNIDFLSIILISENPQDNAVDTIARMSIVWDVSLANTPSLSDIYSIGISSIFTFTKNDLSIKSRIMLIIVRHIHPYRAPLKQIFSDANKSLVSQKSAMRGKELYDTYEMDESIHIYEIFSKGLNTALSDKRR